MNLSKHLLAVLPFILVFLASIYIPHDPDLGWHLKYGEYFFQHGQILRDNTFSTMMPDFKWANSSWGTDLISYLIFNNFGFIGLSIAAALVITLTFYFFSKVANLTTWDKTLLFPLLLFFEDPVNSVSFRGQLLSILFLGMMFYLLISYQLRQSKKIWLMIPLFWLWINIHGQSVLGLFLLFAWMAIYLLVSYFTTERNKTFLINELKTLGPIIILTALVTLINPFRIGVYHDALTHFGNSQLQFIAEYLPFDDLSVPWWNQVVVGVLLIFGFMFLFFTDQHKQNLPMMGIISVLYALSLLVRRYAWSMYYLTLPLLKPISQFFKPDSTKVQNISSVVILVGSILAIVYFKLPLTELRQMSWDKYCSNYVGCSPKAAQFIIDNHLQNNLLTFYDLGGFLIWNYPQLKPSIDGRMHLWKDDKGISGFEQYYPLEQDMKDIDQSRYDAVLMSPDKPMYERLIELTKEKKWKLEYEDNYVGVFVRSKN